MLENQLNVIALFIVITSMLPLCIIYAKTNEYLGKKKEIRAFKGMLVSFMVYTLVDLRCITDHFPNAFPRLFGCFVMSLGFAAMSTSCYFWFLYVFSSARVKYTSRRIIHKIATIPMVLLVIMLFTPLHVAAYDVTETGIVLRPMLMVVIILDYLYLLCATVISIYKTLHEKK